MYTRPTPPAQLPLFTYLNLDRLARLTSGLLDDAAVDFFARGHCASMALALHKLTGWPIFCTDYHAFVKSPRGYLDAAGLRHLRKLQVRPPTAGSYEEDDENYDWCYPVPAQELDDFRAQEHLELVIPFAEAVLDRYFRPTTALKDEGDDGDGDTQVPTQLCFWETGPFHRRAEPDMF